MFITHTWLSRTPKLISIAYVSWDKACKQRYMTTLMLSLVPYEAVLRMVAERRLEATIPEHIVNLECPQLYLRIGNSAFVVSRTMLPNPTLTSLSQKKSVPNT